MTFHFISGLPRSGSTLLGALLRQNPRFSASMTSPVASLLVALQSKMTGGEFGVFFNDARRESVVRGLFESYYSGADRAEVIFDTNRTWTARTPLIMHLFPNSRIICCVREIGWIIDSIECMLAKNPLQVSRIFNFQPGASVYARVEAMMNSDSGLIGLPWSTLREAWFGAHAGQLVLLRYSSLVGEPGRVLSELYKLIDEPFFEHDLNNVVYAEADYDALLGMPGLHTVRNVVAPNNRKCTIPPDLFAKYSNTEFWARPELNPNRVTIL